MDLGHHLKVPVGKRLLGRMFNVFGAVIDEKEGILRGEWRREGEELYRAMAEA